ncbi:MAG TPA: DNA replication and repair protein RecF [Thermoanaerobaculia bacterium]|nr:DNA replication and repair protein RecF [Thermoanaerobaculia bacterium]
MLSILAASHFRNLEPLKWGPGPGSHLLLGGNGAGKTSVLEAIYVAATTRSFRTSRLEDCLRHGAETFHVEAEVETDHHATLEVSWVERKRVRLLNGRTASLAEHLGALPVVAWTWAEAEVLVGPPKARRRFMDRGVVGSRAVSLEILNRYREALAHKRELLLQGGEGLEVWNHLLAAAAAELIRLRHAYVERLREALAGVLEQSGLPFPPIEVRYRPSPSDGVEGADAIADNLERVKERERRRQLPLVGPHRDELEILWGGHDLRRVASAGERKSLSLLLLAAHGRALEAVGTRPVYLLDDADAELSPQTHAAVWNVFRGVEQVIATSNRPRIWLTLEVGKAWEMERGRMRALE